MADDKEKDFGKVDATDLESLVRYNNAIQQSRSFIADLELRKSQVIVQFNSLDQRIKEIAELALDKAGVPKNDMKDYVINLDTGNIVRRTDQGQNLI